METTCIVCFESSLWTVKCENKGCSTVMCEGCFNDYVKFCGGENILPKCPNTNCNTEYLYGTFKGKERVYYDILHKYLKSHQDFSSYQDVVNEQSLIAKFKQEKLKFLREKCPPAIRKVAEIALKKKMNEVDKNNKMFIREMNLKANKNCMNLFCTKGKLVEYGDNYKCNLCEQEFCKKCEGKAKVGHICKQEEVESLRMIQNMVKCPKCLLSIQRSYGCNAMTCTMCGTHFDYSTGKEGTHGNNHNESLQVHNYSRYKPYLELKDSYDEKIGVLLLKLQDKVPKIVGPEGVVGVMAKLEGGESCLKDLVIKYGEYRVAMVEQKRYYKMMSLLQDYHMEGKLTVEVLERIIESLKIE